jgi:DNA-binding NarL/FixJ family response regulator
MKALQSHLNLEDKDLMEKLLSTGHLDQKFAQRLQTVLLRARGKQAADIADFLGIHQSSVSVHQPV